MTGRPTRRAGASYPAVPLVIVFTVFGLLWLELFGVAAGRPVAVVFPAATDPDQALRAIVEAGGLPMRRERSRLFDHLVWVAAAEDPDFAGRVRGLGARLIMNPAAFGGCLLERRR